MSGDFVFGDWDSTYGLEYSFAEASQGRHPYRRAPIKEIILENINSVINNNPRYWYLIYIGTEEQCVREMQKLEYHLHPVDADVDE